MSPKPIKFRNILGELSVAKLYGGEHLGVTAPADFDLRKEISKIGKLDFGQDWSKERAGLSEKG